MPCPRLPFAVCVSDSDSDSDSDAQAHLTAGQGHGCLAVKPEEAVNCA